MELIKKYIFDLNETLPALVSEYGDYIYAILFLIIFVETGLVIMPLLPGDSLLFAAGSIAALGSINVFYLMILLFIAAVLGDSLNYYIGKTLGLKVLKWKIAGRRLVKEQYIEKTHQFYEKHGPKTIVLARFVPIVRTFAPFVAGVGEMSYKKFFFYNVFGGALWVSSILMLGYWFGTTEIVQKNFETVILAIIFLSILPIILEYMKHKLRRA